MLNIEELEFIKKVLIDSKSQDEMTLNIIDRINKFLKDYEEAFDELDKVLEELEK